MKPDMKPLVVLGSVLGFHALIVAVGLDGLKGKARFPAHFDIYVSIAFYPTIAIVMISDICPSLFVSRLSLLGIFIGMAIIGLVLQAILCSYQRKSGSF